MIKFDEPIYQTDKIYEHVVKAKIKRNKSLLSRNKIKSKVLRRIDRFKCSKIYFHNLHIVHYNENIKNSLIGCYDTEAKYFELIKYLIEQSKINTNSIYNSKCPYCSINTANTIDHILPKSLYPELSFTPGNLIYVCSICNNIKNDDYKEGKNRLFINPYRDTFINDVYLIVNLNLYKKNGRYKLLVSLKIDTSKFSKENSIIINNHYEKLNLIPLLKNELTNFLSELEDNFDCNPYPNQMRTYKRCYDNFVTKKGVNHYKTALYRTLITTDIVKEYYEKNKLEL